jgi:hypothetical protein
MTTSNIQDHGHIDLADMTSTIGTPLRVGSSAFAKFDARLSHDLDSLETRFDEFVTSDSLGNSLKRNRG